MWSQPVEKNTIHYPSIAGKSLGKPRISLVKIVDLWTGFDTKNLTNMNNEYQLLSYVYPPTLEAGQTAKLRKNN
jgi:hypothetical protein